MRKTIVVLALTLTFTSATEAHWFRFRRPIQMPAPVYAPVEDCGCNKPAPQDFPKVDEPSQAPEKQKEELPVTPEKKSIIVYAGPEVINIR